MVVADDQRNIKVEQSADGSAVVSGDHNHIDQSRTVNIHYHLPEKQPPSQRIDRNEKTLLSAVWAEVQDRLRQSLHNAVLLTLGKTEQRDQVGRPWDSQIRIANQASRPLPTETPIAAVFDRDDINGKLLILGNPGAGKTTTLLDLAAALVQRANSDPTQPIPVLFNLSSWQKENQTLKDWLLGELKLKYGVSPKLGEKWLEAQILLPLLDGLDELPPQRQEPAVQRINDWLQSGEGASQLVVCSRREEYDLYATKLSLNGAICLEPLTEAQLATYFAALGMEPLWDTVRHDPDFLELVRTPLLLSVSILANEAIDPAQWQRLTTAQERLDYLLDAYIVRQLHSPITSRTYPPQKQPTPQQTRHWLTWLAQQLQAQSEDEFLIEKMQPSSLNKKSHALQYIALFLILRGLPLAIIFLILILTSFVTELASKIAGEAAAGSFSINSIGFLPHLITIFSLTWLFGILVSSIIYFDSIKIIRTTEKLVFSANSIKSRKLWRSVNDSIHSSAKKGAFLVFLLSMLAYVFGDESYAIGFRDSVSLYFPPDFLLLDIAISGIILGYIMGMCIGFSNGFLSFCKTDMESRIIPNHGIIQSLRNSPFLFLLSTFLNLFIVCVLIFISEKSLAGLQVLIPIGLALSLFLVAFSEGTLPVFQHFSLRLILYSLGKIPWNYARFLNYCTERLLLQRVGGRYRFIHRLVQERFAATSGHRP